MTTDPGADTDHRQTITRFFDAIVAGDSATLLEILRPDAVTRWPQSGERITGALSCVRVHENYPGGPPSYQLRADLGRGRHVGRRDDPEVRRGTLVRGQHRRVRRTADRADDRLLRAGVPSPGVARAVGRTRGRDGVVPDGDRPEPIRRAPPADLAAPFPDPHVEPLPGDRLRDERRVGHPRAVDRDPAPGDQPPSLALATRPARLRPARPRSPPPGPPRRT